MAILTDMPTTSALPVWIVRLFAPVPIVSDVVEVAFVPGAFTAVTALAAAAAALLLAFVALVLAALAEPLAALALALAASAYPLAASR
jgi:hypothetical protein